MVDRVDHSPRGWDLPFRDNAAKPDIDRIRATLLAIDAALDDAGGGLEDLSTYAVQALTAGVTDSQFVLLAGVAPVQLQAAGGTVTAMRIADNLPLTADFSQIGNTEDRSGYLDEIAPGFIFRFGPEPSNDTWAYFVVTGEGARTGEKGAPGAYVQFPGTFIGGTRTLPTNNGNSWWQVLGRPTRAFVQARDIANPGGMTSGTVTGATAATEVVAKVGHALGTLAVQQIFDLVAASNAEHTQANPPGNKAATPAGVAEMIDQAVHLAVVQYRFSASTSIGNPVAGDMRLNNLRAADVTRIAIDDIDVDGNDLGDYWATLDDTGIAGNYGMLFIRDLSDQDLLIYKVTAVFDNSGWVRLDVSHVAGGTFGPSHHSPVGLWFVPAGPSPIRVLTQAQYDAATKDAATFYYIRS